MSSRNLSLTILLQFFFLPILFPFLFSLISFSPSVLYRYPKLCSFHLFLLDFLSIGLQVSFILGIFFPSSSSSSPSSSSSSCIPFFLSSFLPFSAFISLCLFVFKGSPCLLGEPAAEQRPSLQFSFMSERERLVHNRWPQGF